MEFYPKILLVDDKPENLLAMESILENEKYSFVRANSAKEVLKILLKEDNFALILMDVNMPEMNGLDTARMIYKREKLANIPIIFITANDYSEENIFNGYLSGGVDYIVKPINPELLKIKVRIFIELFNKNRQLQQQEQKLKQINYDLEEKIREKQKIEEELRLRNIQLSDAQKLTHLGAWEWNILTNRITGSDEIYEIYECDKDLTADIIFQKISPKDVEYVKLNIAHAITRGTSFDIYFRYFSSDGTVKYINKKGRVTKNERNEVVTITGTCQDITDLKKTEEQLKIFSLMERMLNEIYIFRGSDFRLLYANEEALRNLGWQLNDLQDLTLFNILREYKKSTFKRMIEPLLTGNKEKLVFFGSIRRKDKSAYPVEVHLQVIEQGEQKVFLASVLNLTERKRTEQVLASSLKEKEILLKEIHHRVKNNLQIIYSLLNLQSSTVDDENVLQIFKESQNRIKSMALIHEKLYKHNNLSLIDFSEYINDLIASLVFSYRVNTSDIHVKINTDQIYLNIDLAISLGLCITELVSNCFKYAFPQGTQGEVGLEIKLTDENKLVVTIQDNGIGLPENFDFESGDSLGLKLVSSLTEQHYGQFEIFQDGITCFILEIPVKDDTVARTINPADKIDDSIKKFGNEEVEDHNFQKR